MATRRTAPALLFAFLAAPWPAVAQPVPTDWKEIRKPALRPFRPVPPRRLRTGQGDATPGVRVAVAQDRLHDRGAAARGLWP